MAHSAEQQNKKPAQVLGNTENVVNRQFGPRDKSRATTHQPQSKPSQGVTDATWTCTRSSPQAPSGPRRYNAQGVADATWTCRRSSPKGKGSHMHCKACTSAVQHVKHTSQINWRQVQLWSQASKACNTRGTRATLLPTCMGSCMTCRTRMTVEPGSAKGLYTQK